MRKSFFDQLTDSQKKAVFHFEGPLLVIAGPGSGKTRVITYRIAALIDQGVPASDICAITFTNKAAEEMRTRCSQLLSFTSRSQISTFHSLCARILRQYAKDAQLNSSFSIYDSADQYKLIKQAVKDVELDAANFSPARMLEAVSALKNRLIRPRLFQENADDFFSSALSKIYSRYQYLLEESNALDFDDLLLKTAFLLKDNTAVRDELSGRYKFLLIDEYQDTNHAQYQIAKLLVSTHSNICATGDPDQSIYRWRGADIRNILDFEKDWPDALIVKLEENFRSTPNILKAADNLIVNNFSRKAKSLKPTLPEGSDIILTCAEDQTAEADSVAKHVQSLADRGVSLKDIAVFYRINSMSRPLEEAFIKNKIPYQIVRGVEFYNRKEIRDLLAYLKALVNPDDEIALIRIINTPARGIGKTTIDRIKAFALNNNISFYTALTKAARIDTLAKAAKAKVTVFVNMLEKFKSALNKPVAEIAETVFKDTGLAEYLKQTKDADALENVNELISAAAIYDKTTDSPSLADYLQQISLFSDVDSYDTARQTVALMTMHAAKGLEFDNVFIIGLEDGILPHERSSDDEDDLEEERRLFFVGITRAKQNLFISFSQYRTIRGQLLRSIQSPFLYELGLPPEGLDSALPGRNDSVSDGIEYDAEYLDDLSRRSLKGEGGSLQRRRTNNEWSKLTAGRLVRHDTFGLGHVKEFIDMGENSIVVVRFNDGFTKSLKLKYAKLSIL